MWLGYWLILYRYLNVGNVNLGSPGGTVVKMQEMQETQVPSLSWEDPLAIHSSILTWKIPWTEEPSGLVHRLTKNRTQLSTHALMVNVINIPLLKYRLHYLSLQNSGHWNSQRSSLAIFIIKSYTIPNLQPSFEGLKKTHKHMNMLRDICLWEMTEFWILRNELLKFHEVFPSGPLFLWLAD